MNETKYFQNWTEACAFCAAQGVSNESVKYEPATNRYLVVVDEKGQIQD